MIKINKRFVLLIGMTFSFLILLNNFSTKASRLTSSCSSSELSQITINKIEERNLLSIQRKQTLDIYNRKINYLYNTAENYRRAGIVVGMQKYIKEAQNLEFKLMNKIQVFDRKILKLKSQILSGIDKRCFSDNKKYIGKQESLNSQKVQLGVLIQELDRNLKKTLKLPKNLNGVLINKIDLNSIAEKAGFRVSDIIISYDGKPIFSTVELQRLVSFTQKGNFVNIGILRYNNLLGFYENQVYNFNVKMD